MPDKYKRILNISNDLKSRSIFLFGPRQTGKTSLLKALYPNAVYYDLLEADTFRELSSKPELIRLRLKPNDSLIIVDEVQKLPAILDEVHSLIERSKNLRFVLTGSSARKLRRGGVNLLAGRAWIRNLYPLVSPELDYERLMDRLNRGSLPPVIDSPDPKEDLKVYVGTYLREEIHAEGLTRSIENFSRFLDVAGACNGKQINFTKVGEDAQVPSRTIMEYFQILVDTLVGFLVEPYQKTIKRKPVATAKFYFFDIGVSNVLVKQGPVVPQTKTYGETLEHLLILELRAYLDYKRIDKTLCYWRSQSKLEVNAVIGDDVAIEVKGSEQFAERDLRGLRALSEEIKLKRKILVCNTRYPVTTDDGVEVIPFEVFLRNLWEGEIVEQ